MGELLDKAKGKLKEVLGAARGDRSKQAEGMADQAKGEAKGRVEEVKQVGGMDSASRPRGRADVARFYNAASAVTVWNATLRQVAAVRGRSLAWNARAFALLNVAISDALVAVMETKYRYLFWRPETAIREAADDGNASTEPDGAFVPYIASPCFRATGRRTPPPATPRVASRRRSSETTAHP